MNNSDLITVFMILGTLFTVVNICFLYIFSKILLVQIKNQISTISLYISTLNDYGQIMQDLKDKDMFDTINSKKTRDS